MVWAAHALHWRDQRDENILAPKGGRQSAEPPPYRGLETAITLHEHGMPSKRKSSACVDYVPALCTHRPSLLPSERQVEKLGPAVASVAGADRWELLRF